jgi:hypothetical protein
MCLKNLYGRCLNTGSWGECSWLVVKGPVFYICILSGWGVGGVGIRFRKCPQKFCWLILSCVKIGTVKVIIFERAYMKFPPPPNTFYIFRPIWGEKISARDLDNILLCYFGFLENRLTEGHTFLVRVNGVTFTRVPWHILSFWKQRTPV